MKTRGLPALHTFWPHNSGTMRTSPAPCSLWPGRQHRAGMCMKTKVCERQRSDQRSCPDTRRRRSGQQLLFDLLQTILAKEHFIAHVERWNAKAAQRHSSLCIGNQTGLASGFGAPSRSAGAIQYRGQGEGHAVSSATSRPGARGNGSTGAGADHWQLARNTSLITVPRSS